MAQYILALDQGASESKAVLVDNKGKIVAQAAYPLKHLLVKPDWVEYKPDDILKSQLNAIRALFRKIGNKKRQIAAIGLASQQSTIVLWDRATGKPVCNAISYQDPRGTYICRERADYRETVRERTGLTLSPYYSASKIRWVLDNVKSAQKLAEKGRILCGTVNTYLMWHLTGRSVYATDHTNAAQTLLFNILTRSWDKELLDLFAIPSDMLPAILPTSAYFGDAVIEGQTIPIHSNIVERQASLIGHGCFHEGDINISYGRDGFILINTERQIFILPGLLSSIAWSNESNTTYLLEGTLNAVGSILEWMRNNLGIINPRDNMNELCRQSGERLFILPAITGLGSPHWDTNTTTCIYGLKSTTTKGDIVRSAIESIAFLVKDNFDVIQRDGRVMLKKIVVSGEVSEISHLLQFQADLLQMPLHKAKESDSTIRGVAFLAGLNRRIWQGLPSIKRLTHTSKTFNPKLDSTEIEKLYERWKLTCLYSKEWSKNFS